MLRRLFHWLDRKEPTPVPLPPVAIPASPTPPIRFLVFGYRHHKEDAPLESHRILPIGPKEDWGAVLVQAVADLNDNPDLKQPVILTFVTIY